MARKLGLAVGALMAIVLLGLGIYTWTPERPFDAEAARAAAAAYDARIIRDAYGVPHIFGDRDADVAFGVGYAHAEDDWHTIETTLLASRGTLAARDGIDAVETDFLVDFLGLWDVIEARYESDLGADTRALIEGYAAGLTLWAIDNPQSISANVLPITGQDVAAGFMFRTPFFFGFQDTLQEVFGPERAHPISVNDAETAFKSVPAQPVEKGSNAFALAPSRTADGHTRLVVNSHQPMTGPVAWWELRVKSGEGWDMTGATFPGAPMVLHGASSKLGWANTVNKPDVTDVWVLDVDDAEEPRRYRMDGEWRDFETARARFRIKLFGPFSWPVERRLIRSVHGPAVTTGHGTYAIAHTALDQIRIVEQFWRTNKAETLQDWLDVMAINAIPSLNYIFATAEGQIGYLYNARWPRRPQGWDWQAYLPGDRSDALWQGIETFSALPLLVDPAAGYVLNANNTPFRATAPPDDLRPEDFEDHFGIETVMTNRATRALALLDADGKVTRTELEAIKYDACYAPDSSMMTLIRELPADPDDPGLKEAVELLKSWDGCTDRESRAAALGVLFRWRVFDSPSGEEGVIGNPLSALATAAAQMNDRHGRLDVPWGQVNRLRRGEVDLAVSGGPDVLRAIYGGRNLNDDGRFEAIAGDTYILFSDWDGQGGWVARSVHQFGSATLDATSPHYADQAPLFAEEALKIVPLAMEDLLAEATRDYRVGGQP